MEQADSPHRCRPDIDQPSAHHGISFDQRRYTSHVLDHDCALLYVSSEISRVKKMVLAQRNMHRTRCKCKIHRGAVDTGAASYPCIAIEFDIGNVKIDENNRHHLRCMRAGCGVCSP